MTTSSGGVPNVTFDPLGGIKPTGLGEVQGRQADLFVEEVDERACLLGPSEEIPLSIGAGKVD